MKPYAKVVVPGSPISKSNFKLHNKDGRAILPYNTGKAHDKYALYEEEIAYYARSQNPTTILEESLIAILKVYYKSEKRHPDTANITKSINPLVTVIKDEANTIKRSSKNRNPLWYNIDNETNIGIAITVISTI